MEVWNEKFRGNLDSNFLRECGIYEFKTVSLKWAPPSGHYIMLKKVAGFVIFYIQYGTDVWEFAVRKEKT